MTGKMLGCRQLPTGERAFHEQRRESRDALGIFAEGARVDDGGRRIVVDVDDRRKVKVKADGASLLADDARDVVGVGVALRGGDPHLRRKQSATAGLEQVMRIHRALQPQESWLEI